MLKSLFHDKIDIMVKSGVAKISNPSAEESYEF